MEFGFTTEQDAFREEVRAFCARHVTPELLERVRARGDEHDSGFYAELARTGWLGLDYPPEYGGLGRDQVMMGIFREETAYFHAPLMTHEVNNIIAHSIRVVAGEEQKRAYIPRVVKGDVIFCMGYSEPGHGSDLAGLRTRAERRGDEYVVNGQKIFTTNAHFANTMLLAARTDPTAAKHEGISLFLLDMQDTPGITIGPLWTLGGWRVNTVYLENVRIPARNLVGRENGGWKALAVALDIERSGLLYIGRCRRALDELARWVRSGARERLAPGTRGAAAVGRLGAELSGARLLSYRVAVMQAQGLVPNQEASMAKVFATELLQRICHAALELIGPAATVKGGAPEAVHAGFFEEGVRWAAMGTIVAGTSEIQRSIIATRGLGLPKAV